MDDFFLEHELQAAIWNALREHADKLDRQSKLANVWFRAVYHDMSPSDHEFMEGELHTHRRAYVPVTAVVMRFERSGKRVSAVGDELEYNLTIEIDDSLIGPQVSARVDGIAGKPSTQEVK